jgi:hypothetical protein
MAAHVDVSQQLQQAVDNGCLRSDGATHETRYDWSKPLHLVIIGPCPPKEDADTNLMQPRDFAAFWITDDTVLLSCIEDSPALPAPATNPFSNKLWYGILVMQMGDEHVASATIRLPNDGPTISGTVETFSVGCIKWTPKKARFAMTNDQ